MFCCWFFPFLNHSRASFEQFKQNTLKHLRGKKKNHLKKERKKQFGQIDKCLTKSLKELLPVGNLLADILPFSLVFNFSLDRIFDSFPFQTGKMTFCLLSQCKCISDPSQCIFFTAGESEVIPLHCGSGCVKASVTHT